MKFSVLHFWGFNVVIIIKYIIRLTTRVKLAF